MNYGKLQILLSTRLEYAAFFSGQEFKVCVLLSQTWRLLDAFLTRTLGVFPNQIRVTKLRRCVTEGAIRSPVEEMDRNFKC